MRTKIMREMFEVMDMMEKEKMIKRYEEFCDGVAGSEDGEYVKLEDVKHLLSPWKDASKELPEDNTKALLHSLGGFAVGYYDRKNMMFVDQAWQKLSLVSHWMYIPEIKEDDQ